MENKIERNEEILKIMIVLLSVGFFSYFLSWAILIPKFDDILLIIGFVLYAVGISGLTMFFVLLIILSYFKLERK